MRAHESLLHLFHPRRSNNHRPALLHPENLFAMVVMTLAFFGMITILTKNVSNRSGFVLGYATNITADQVIAITNAKRAEAGLSPLSFNNQLSQAATKKAEDMFGKQYWAHVSPSGTQPWDFIRQAGYTYQAAGENLGRDFMGSGELVDAWMASPTHKANIVNPRYQEIGVAVVNGTLEGEETTLVVQMFGRPRSGVVASLPNAAPTSQFTDEPNEVQQQPSVSRELVAQPAPTANPNVLPAMSVFTGTIQPLPSISPLQLQKSLFASIIVLFILVLAYDWVLLGRKKQERVVGLNIGHLLYFGTVLFLVLTFRTGGIL